MLCLWCYPKQFNDLEKLPTAPEESEETYQYGLPTLHKWICCFEMLLHISYRMPFQKWRVAAEDKEAFSSKKGGT